MHELRRFKAWLGVLPVAVLITTAGMVGADDTQGRISGLAYADYFYNLQGTAIPEEANGFRFRRIYFTYDRDLDSSSAVRLQLESNDENLIESGRLGEFVKQAYVVLRNVRAIGSVYGGLSPTPTWVHSEEVWGYRSVEKTILDLRGLAPPTDFGVAVRRDPSSQRPLGWHLMFANGAGNRPENDRGKRFYVSIPARIENLVLQGGFDYEGGPGDRDRYMLTIFGGWQGEKMALGVEAFRRVLKNSGPGGADAAPTGMSVFGRRRLLNRWTAFARYDYFDPNAELEDAGYREQLFIGGADFALRPNVHLIPNVSVNSYAGKADELPDLDADVTLRLTLYTFFP
jgi:hypothetical protein